MEPIVLPKSSNLLKLPEQLYGTIKRVGILNKEPILYGDVNLLKPNDLYYINGAKLIYRYVKSSIEDDSMTYYFDTIKSTATDSLSVPEDERGKIRNAGYLFNEIIYSGDANLIDNGSLFYHDTLPFVSVVSNVDGIINLFTKAIIDGDPETIVTEYRVGPPHNYSKDYLTFEALEDGTFTLTVPAAVTTSDVEQVSYSVDNGVNWITTNNTVEEVVITTPTVTKGNKVLWKGTAVQYTHTYGGSEAFSYFSSTNKFSVSGNLLSLLSQTNFSNITELTSEYEFTSLFANCSNLINAHNLSLNLKKVSKSCFSNSYQSYGKEYNVGLFYNCTNLLTAPELPATTLAYRCYMGMFNGCTSLTSAPELPATTLASGCYGSMFNGCTSLTTAPELPATTLANNCYYSMFQGCTSLTVAPVLPATTLDERCYFYMFKGCTSLITAPELPATTLAGYCYNGMFRDCTSLTTAPVLPATTLAQHCYKSMFYGCSNLNYIKAMFTTTPSNSYTESWVSGVAATGTFVKNSAATWTTTGVNGVPTGWTVETANADTNEITI